MSGLFVGSSPLFANSILKEVGDFRPLDSSGPTLRLCSNLHRTRIEASEASLRQRAARTLTRSESSRTQDGMALR